MSGLASVPAPWKHARPRNNHLGNVLYTHCEKESTMTFRMVTITLLLAVLTAANILTATETNSAYEHLKPLEWTLGDWVGEYVATADIGPIKKGDRVTSYASSRWAYNKTYMFADFQLEIDGEKRPDTHEINGWDAEDNEAVHWIYAEFGSGKGVWTEIGDNKASLRWSVDSKDGKFDGTSYLEKIDDDTHTWQARNVTLDGKPFPDWPQVTMRRQKGKAAGELWSAFCDAFAGNWVGTGNLSADFPDQGWSKGDKFTYHLTYTPDIDKNVLAGDGSFCVAGSDETAAARVSWYWDPDSAQVRAVACWNMGGIEEVTIQRKTAKGFLGTYATKGPGQEKFRARVRVDFPDPDTYTITFIDGEKKGKQLVEWKREKSPLEKASAEDLIDYHKPMLGKWKLTVEAGDEVMHGSGSWQLGKNGKCFLLSAEFDGGPGVEATVGLDPVSGKCVQTSYDSDGTYQVVTIDIPGMGNGKTLGVGLIGRWEEKRFQTDGTVVTAVETLKCLEFSENRRVFVWADRKEQGETLPDWKLTYERP